MIYAFLFNGNRVGMLTITPFMRKALQPNRQSFRMIWAVHAVLSRTYRRRLPFPVYR